MRKGIKPNTREIVHTRVKFTTQRKYALLDGQEFSSLQELIERGANLELLEPWNGVGTTKVVRESDASAYFISGSVQEYNSTEIKDKLYEINHWVDANAQEISSESFSLDKSLEMLTEWKDYLTAQQEYLAKTIRQLKGKDSAYIRSLKELQSEVWSVRSLLVYIITGEEES